MTDSPTAALELDGLTLGYGKIIVVHDLSLRVEPGQIVSVLGPNGAGKTTTVRGVLGLLPLGSGEVRLAGKRITGWPPHRVVAAGLGYVPQGRELFADMSVRDNLRLGGYTMARKDAAARIETLLGYFPKLRERAAQAAGSLSGGEQQMLAIARALVPRPSVLVLDEPSAGLAPRTMRQVFDIVADIARTEGSSVLIAEQNAHQALRVTDHAYVLNTGRVEMSGPPARLLADDRIRAAYLGDVEADVDAATDAHPAAQPVEHPAASPPDPHPAEHPAASPPDPHPAAPAERA